MRNNSELSIHWYSAQLSLETTADALDQEHVVAHNIYKTLDFQCTVHVYNRKQCTLQDRAFVATIIV